MGHSLIFNSGSTNSINHFLSKKKPRRSLERSRNMWKHWLRNS